MHITFLTRQLQYANDIKSIMKLTIVKRLGIKLKHDVNAYNYISKISTKEENTKNMNESLKLLSWEALCMEYSIPQNSSYI